MAKKSTSKTSGSGVSTVKVTGISVKDLSGSANTVVATWKFSQSVYRTDGYSVRWDYYNGKSNRWILGSVETVVDSNVKDRGKQGASSVTVNNKSRQSTFSVPLDGNPSKVRVLVRPEATTHKVSNKDVPYFKGAWAQSKDYAPANVKTALAAQNKARANAKKNAQSAQSSAKANFTAAEKCGNTETQRIKKAGLYAKAAELWGDAADWYDKAGDAVNKAVAEQKKVQCEAKVDKTNSGLYSLYESYAKKALAPDSKFTSLCEITKKVSSATAKKKAAAKLPKGKTLKQNAAKTAWGYYTAQKSASGYVADAKAARSKKSYGDSAKAERNAAKMYDKAAAWWTKAAGVAPSSGVSTNCTNLATKNSGLADSCEERASADDERQDAAKALADEKASVPHAPSSVEVTQSGNSLKVEWQRPAGWATYTYLQVRVDRGSWTAVKSIYAKANTRNSVAQSHTHGGSAGHVYEFRLRTSTEKGKNYSDWAYSSEYLTAPARGRLFSAAIASNGSAVVLKWMPDEATIASVESFEVQYSNFRTTSNAWEVGATASIQSMDVGLAKRVTKKSGSKTVTAYYEATIDVSQWDEGQWYFRLYAKNATGLSLPALLAGKASDGKTNESHGYVTASVKVLKAAMRLSTPTGLKASVLSDGNVKLTWTDALESGASYEIMHSANVRAFAVNALGDISTETWDSPGNVGKSATRTFTCTGLERGKQHVFRVRKVKDESSALAQVSKGVYDVKATVPPKGDTVLTPKPTNLTATIPAYEGAVKLTWSGSAVSGERFEVQYTDNPNAFADNAEADIDTADYENLPSGASSFTYTLSELETARTWYIRVRKTSDEGMSAWGTLKSSHASGVAAQTTTVLAVALPPSKEELDKLSAPTASLTDMSYQVGDAVIMSWLHNSEGDTGQTAYQVEVTVKPSGGSKSKKTLSGTEDNAVSYPTASLSDGTEVWWRVRTQGAYEGYWSPWSQTRHFGVYAPPAAAVELSCGGSQVDTESKLTSLPLAVRVSASSSASNPIVEARVSIVSSTMHETADDDGSSLIIGAGEEVFVKYLSASDFSGGTATVSVAASDAVIDSGCDYAARVAVVTQMGMRSTSPDARFSVDWGDEMAQPSASATFDSDDYACRIFPACYVADAESMTTPEIVAEIPESDESRTSEIEDVYSEDDPEAGSEEQSAPEQVSDESEETVADAVESVESGEEPELTDAEQAVIDLVGAEEPALDDSEEPDFSSALSEDDDAADGRAYRPDTKLDVYRINFDGSLTAIARGLPNDGASCATDPHPSFGTCTYRIVAHDTAHDVQSACEIDVDTPVKRVVVTWDEEWTDSATATEDDFVDYAGFIVELPYDVELQEQHSVERTVNSYQGRRLGVAYFGEHVDTSATFNASIRRGLDDDTLAALRRLAVWPGPCYVRDRTGLGFWATADVDISHTYQNKKVGVSIKFGRVEGPEGEDG